MGTPERRAGLLPERWEPLRELEQIADRMRRTLEETFGAAAGELGEGGRWSPLVDVEEQDDAYVVEAELPGVKREDVNIELVGNELAITGEVKEREHAGALRRRTRRYGRFSYRLTLPDQVDVDKIDANLKDGVLTVRVPKSERAQRRQIQISG